MYIIHVHVCYVYIIINYYVRLFNRNIHNYLVQVIKLSTINPSIHLEGVNLTQLLGHTLLTILTYTFKYIITTSVLTSVVKVMDLCFSYCYCYCKAFVIITVLVINSSQKL